MSGSDLVQKNQRRFSTKFYLLLQEEFLRCFGVFFFVISQKKQPTWVILWDTMNTSIEKHSVKISLKGLKSSDPAEVDKAVMLIYRNYYPGVSNYFRYRGFTDMDIQDVFHDGILVFLKALKNGKIKDQASAGGYFFTICKHIGLKKGAQDSHISLDEINLKMPEEIPNETEEEDHRNQLRLKNWKLMESLGKPCKDLLEKSFVENKKIVAFFTELGYKNAQVARTAKYKCLKRLKDKFAQDPQAQYLLKILFS